MLSQQSSLSGTRTALMCQLAIAATEAASFGPSKMPQPWMQAYSVPERSTPSKRIGGPAPFNSRFPDTRSARPVGGGGAGVGVADGGRGGVGVGLTVGAGVGLNVGVGVGVAVRVAVGLGIGVPRGRVLTVGWAVGDALSAVVPLRGATVRGCVPSTSQSINIARAAAAQTSRNTSNSSLPSVDDRSMSDAAPKRPPVHHGSVASWA